MNLAKLIEKDNKESDVKVYFNGEEIVSLRMTTNTFYITEKLESSKERTIMTKQRRGRHD